jgi:hypothetical protein
MEEIEFSWLFEGRLRQCKNVLPDGLNWLCYFVGSSKSHRENSIIFVDMKNVVKSTIPSLCIRTKTSRENSNNRFGRM